MIHDLFLLLFLYPIGDKMFRPTIRIFKHVFLSSPSDTHFVRLQYYKGISRDERRFQTTVIKYEMCETRGLIPNNIKRARVTNTATAEYINKNGTRNITCTEVTIFR